MPAAAVLFLQAEHDGAIYGATGQHAHGFWLHSWRAFGAAAGGAPGDALGDTLHDQRPLRQFTVSPLLGLTNVRHGQTLVQAGDEARLRLTALDDLTQDALLSNWLVRLPARVTFAGIAWRVRRLGLAAADDPDAGYAAYADLRDAYRAGAPARWALGFESPLAFHLQDGNCLPFPLPGLLAAGWLNRWNEYSPVPLLAADDTTPAFLRRVEAGLRVSQYRLKTVSFRFRHEGPDGRRSREVPQIGCVGEAAFDGAALTPADRAAVATLVDFAFYCGSGHHTTMGMGQTRVRK